MKSSSAHNDPKPPAAPPRRAEKVDVAEAMDRLTKEEWNRLEIRARQLTIRGILEGEWEQILHDAVALSLEGICPWYVDTNPTMYEHLRWALQRISFASRRKLLVKDSETDGWIPKCFNPELKDDDVFWDNLPDMSTNTERGHEAREKIEIILAYFKSDPLIVQVLKCRMDDYDREEIAAKLGISTTDFETIRKRIKRGSVGLMKRLWISKK